MSPIPHPHRDFSHFPHVCKPRCAIKPFHGDNGKVKGRPVLTSVPPLPFNERMSSISILSVF
jgi:hypothetical protein